MSLQDRSNLNPSRSDRPPNSYIGRFAPSPTGPLHMGSLTAALGSYLDAKSQVGQWLLRMEDLDPPREDEAARSLIPKQLEQHGLLWDGELTYQSNQLDRYRDILSQLGAMGFTYSCCCSRQRIRELDGIYDRKCLIAPPPGDAPSALRFKVDDAYSWVDNVQGHMEFSAQQIGGDFVVLRKDGLFSYQLAVAIDDCDQGVTNVVRGADLIDSTPRQAAIMLTLGWQPPEYAHLPVVLSDQGQKLSKQHHAPQLNPKTIEENLITALQILGQQPLSELADADQDSILKWAISHWNINAVPRAMPQSEL